MSVKCFFFFQAEDGIRDLTVTEFRRVLFRSPRCGIAPGFIQIIAGHLIKEYESVDTVSLRVGALPVNRSEEHTSELQSQSNLVCRLLLEKKKQTNAHPSVTSPKCGGRPKSPH